LSNVLADSPTTATGVGGGDCFYKNSPQNQLKCWKLIYCQSAHFSLERQRPMNPNKALWEKGDFTRLGGRIVMGNWIPNDPTLVAQILKISSA
jgi:hypothetical protein